MARLLGVSLSGYYQWRQRQPSQRSQQKQALQQAIARVYARFDGSAGSPLITAELREQAEFAQLSRTRVAREMQTLGLRCRLRMAKKPRTTQSDPTHRVVANQLDRCFRTEAPNQVWVSDLTYLKVAGQWRYLVIFLDLFSRKVVGWDLSDSLEASGTVRALQRALQSRRPAVGLLVHSDRGMQYSCQAFQELLRRHALVPSMSRKGDCWDNAVAESFFSHLKARVIEGRSFRDERELRRVVFEYIEIHYARERKHSSNGWKTPQQYENEFAEKLPRTP